MVHQNGGFCLDSVNVTKQLFVGPVHGSHDGLF